MKIDELEFWADYALEDVTSTASADYEFCYRRSEVLTTGGLTLEVPSKPSDYLVLRVRPAHGASWTGRFEPGVEGMSGVFATPSENTCCVVVKGQAYWIPVTAPADYQTIPSCPVKKVLAVPKKPLMIFVDYVRLVAYNADGLAWQTADLSWDGIDLDAVTTDHIKGRAWDAPKNRHVKFIVDVDDGACQGGSSPDLYAAQGKETH
jgi:hypothetical protein